jgi:hypothetical protein
VVKLFYNRNRHYGFLISSTSFYNSPIVSEEEAKHFLAEHNYYLKLASYRANYKKYSSGKRIGQYQNLDFAYLKELSTIDMHLRYIIVQMALDIEHYLKVKLLSSIEDNPDEDGYHLIQCFFADDNNFSALKEIQRHKSSDYCKSLIEKYNKCIYDFVCLVYAYNEIVTSEATKKYRYNELNDLFTGRMKERKDYFSKNNLITSSQ